VLYSRIALTGAAMKSPTGYLTPLCALALAGCVTTQSNYDELTARYNQTQAANRELQSENAALQAQIAQQQQQNMYTVAADLLFPPGAFDITPNGQAALNDIAAKLRNLKNSKIVVYGYTDDAKPGGKLLQLGIKTNLDLSSKRADTVATYLTAHRINRAIVSAEGRGDTHPVAPNTTAEGRAKNRRIEIVVEGPGN
jgi:chemotaxis protein MotB